MWKNKQLLDKFGEKIKVEATDFFSSEFATKPSTYYISYKYNIVNANGETNTFYNQIDVNEYQYKRVKEGNEILEVLYLPQQPHISGAKGNFCQSSRFVFSVCFFLIQLYIIVWVLVLVVKN